MITLYRSLSVTIAVLVGVQAGSHAWASAGLSRYIMGGAVVDKSMMEDTGGPLPFPEVAGILVHGLNGGIVIPAVALALLVVSFFARVPGAILRAGVVLGLVALQMTLGYAGHDQPVMGLFHGLNALVLFGAALWAWRVTAPRPATRDGAETTGAEESVAV
ncbi:MAG: hypothetical protein IPL41_02665 [Micropruina sp.]|nr:hypothetical protein [Micropruina sp.]